MLTSNNSINFQEVVDIKSSHKYSKIINIFGDIPLSNPDISLSDVLVEDNNDFFRNVLRRTDAEIQSELNSVTNYYADRYGIDLGKFKKGQGYMYSGEHRFYSYTKQGNYSATQLFGNCCSFTDYTLIEGGFLLVVGAPGINARGTYGKNIGEKIPPGSVILYGYYVLVDEYNNGKIYHFRSATPSSTDLETPLHWNLDVYDNKEQKWGKSIGSTIVDTVDIMINRPTTVTKTQLVPTTVPVTVPTGTQTTTNKTTIVSPFPLTQSVVNSVPQKSVLTSTVEVPTYSRVIRDEIVNITEEKGSMSKLITRGIITF